MTTPRKRFAHISTEAEKNGLEKADFLLAMLNAGVKGHYNPDQNSNGREITTEDIENARPSICYALDGSIRQIISYMDKNDLPAVLEELGVSDGKSADNDLSNSASTKAELENKAGSNGNIVTVVKAWEAYKRLKNGPSLPSEDAIAKTTEKMFKHPVGHSTCGKYRSYFESVIDDMQKDEREKILKK